LRRQRKLGRLPLIGSLGGIRGDRGEALRLSGCLRGSIDEALE
jgi:hypothetical protein